jgi:hypothetical protein
VFSYIPAVSEHVRLGQALTLEAKMRVLLAIAIAPARWPWARR